MERSTCRYSKLCKINFEAYNYSENVKVCLTPCCNRDVKQLAEFSFDKTYFSEHPMECINSIVGKDCTIFNNKCSGCIESISSLEVSLSKKCNLKCVMCGFNTKTVQNQESVYKTTLENLKGNNLETLTLTCEGEPFAYDWVYDYLKTLTKNDFSDVYIISNGILIDDAKLEETAKVLKANGIKLKLVISIHSFDIRTYAKIMKSKKLDKVLETVKLAYSLRILDGINYVIQPANINEYKNARKEADKVMKGLGDKIIYLLDFCNYSLSDIDEKIAKQIDNKS